MAWVELRLIRFYPYKDAKTWLQDHTEALFFVHNGNTLSLPRVKIRLASGRYVFRAAKFDHGSSKLSPYYVRLEYIRPGRGMGLESRPKNPLDSRSCVLFIMRFLRIFPLLLILLGVALLLERPAYAYADPGTGLLAIQAVGSALVAGGWYLRKKIAALFHRDTPAKPEPEANPIPKEGEDSSHP
jgi:hypothetical protein